MHEAIWQVLVDTGCAEDSEFWRTQFLVHAESGHWREFRISGSLGFGGKVWSPLGGSPPRVSCYPEDATPERISRMDEANKRLKELWEERRP